MAYYYGWKDKDIQSMQFDSYQKYLLGTYVIQEQNNLDSIFNIITPKLKTEKIKEKIGKLQRSIKSKFKNKISSANAEYLAKQQLEQGSNNG